MHQNYPNPFNPSTQISFAIESDGIVELAVFNVKGQKVRNIYRGFAAKDEVIDFTWEGIDNDGNTVGSGIYFSKLKTETKSYTKKMNLIK